MKGGEIIMHFLKNLKGLQYTIENKGEELIVTAKGSKESIKTLEKKLNAMKELCCDCCSDEGGCC